MIHEVDDALQSLLTEDVLAGTGVEVVFEAPTREWAARRNAPTVNLFLYDIRESVAHRQQGRVPEYDADGTTVAIHSPPRWFALSYLATAWTKRPQDEHRLLSVLLAGLLVHPVLPAGRLSGSLRSLGLAVPCDIARPPGEGRALADVWSALGGELKPSLDLVVTAPLSAGRRVTAPPVTDALLVRAVDVSGDPREAPAREEVRRPRYEGDREEPGAPAVPVGTRRARGEAARRPRPGPVPR
ncbi:DUF4255 domain-containing protein [Streptomyces sp. TRM 70361]|uniref:DUF4255 domain-containing protein n=1 Tax=Streptomyces sp. TRM 70361 TaxID=3116553 RepID=UPI002E7BD58B|nr:DUF4255 domain-containing protein [Streptomyces sp. TRM 70361]MEE1940284.1 DUF4255 domain-containing protein [Streptomyces sp. TRM 70361]